MATKQIDPLPSTVKVGRKLYNVHTVDKMHKRGDMGRVVYDSKHIEIALRSSKTERPFNNNEVHETFWHELTHAILHDMGRDTLNRDERFVEEFSSRLHKAIKSARF